VKAPATCSTELILTAHFRLQYNYFILNGDRIFYVIMSNLEDK